MDDRAILLMSARSEVYRFLGLAFADPQGGALDRLRAQWATTETSLQALSLSTKAPDCAAALASLTSAELGSAHAACFSQAISKECPPYETEYGRANIFQKSQTLADIAGFYRAFGLTLAPDFRDRPDHLAAELEFMEFLCRKEAFAGASGHGRAKAGLCRRARRTFLAEHLGGWALGFARRVMEKAPTGAFASFAGLLEDFLAGEMRSMRLRRGPEPALNETRESARDDTNCGQCPMAPEALSRAGSLQP